jgi:uncharacterized protein YoxC
MLNFEVYKEANIEMGKKVKGNETPQERVTKNKSKHVIELSVGNIVAIVSVAVVILAAIAGGVWSIASKFEETNKTIVSLQKDIETLNNTVQETSSQMSTIYEDMYNDEGVEDKLDNLSEDINELKETLNLLPISASPDLTSSISIEPNKVYFTESSLAATTVIGTDTNGNEYIARDLANEMILLTYQAENDIEVYFLGKFNENYHWDGYCVTNAYYPDGALYGICESNFDDGDRLDFKSFVLSSQDKWLYSDRVCNDDNINTGINKTYTLDYGKKKSFTKENIRVSDILYVDKFLEDTDPVICKYYNGNTSDGKYNDITGNSFEIIYDDAETIKTFYFGNFVDGAFCDSTGEAWEIAYSDTTNSYYYNKGIFKNNSATEHSTTSISNNQINKIIENFEQDKKIEIGSDFLKWKKVD